MPEIKDGPHERGGQSRGNYTPLLAQTLIFSSWPCPINYEALFLIHMEKGSDN